MICSFFPNHDSASPLLRCRRVGLSRCVARPCREPGGNPGRLSARLFPGLHQADSIKDFLFSDPSAWKVSEGDGKQALELVKQSEYKPAVRSPFNIALIKDKVFGDFVVEANCLQTGKEYGHRDMCFFYGYQGPGKFYYTHIATKPDEHAHNCFIVNDAPRTKFAKEVNDGVNWGLGVWHKVRVERKASDGTVRVFFDDMAKPIMIAEDKTFGPGAIGFGSFDDTGKISNIRVWSKDVETKTTPAFK
jgi:hypothetical protein